MGECCRCGTITYGIYCSGCREEEFKSQYDEGKDSSAFVLKGGHTHVIRTKTVTYACGCSIVLGSWSGNATADHVCHKHFQPIREIITKEEYIYDKRRKDTAREGTDQSP
jgi:hypothetical protein